MNISINLWDIAMKKYLNFLILILLLAFTSCGAKTSNVAVKLQGSFSQVAGLFENGAVMIAVGGPSDKPPLLYTVPLNSASFDHTFDNGIWKIMILGWDGATPGETMKGNLYCSVVNNVSFPDQSTLNFNLSQVDTDANLVVDPGHPCGAFIDGLQTVKYASICETETCDSGNYLRYNNTNLSLKFGIPFYEGPIDKHSILTQARFTSEMNECYSAANSNLIDGADYAKLDIDLAATGITLPFRLTGGFHLPIRMEGYEDSVDYTMDCSKGFNNAVTTINSIGEVDAVSGLPKHWSDGAKFIYRMPISPFALTGLPVNTLVRNSYEVVDINGPYNDDNYGDGTISYTCDYTSTTVSTPQACPTTSSIIEGGYVTFDPANGQITLDGSTYPHFAMGNQLTFNIVANYTVNSTNHSENKSFTIGLDPIWGLNYSQSQGTLGSLNNTDQTSNFIDLTNMADSDLNITGVDITGNTGETVVPVVMISSCTNGSPCRVELDASAVTTSATGNVNIHLESGGDVTTETLPYNFVP